MRMIPNQLRNTLTDLNKLSEQTEPFGVLRFRSLSFSSLSGMLFVEMFFTKSESEE